MSTPLVLKECRSRSPVKCLVEAVGRHERPFTSKLTQLTRKMMRFQLDGDPKIAQDIAAQFASTPGLTIP